MEPQMFFPEEPATPDETDIFGHIHDAAYEMTALATSADAKLLGYLLMMVAMEAERLDQTNKFAIGPGDWGR